MLLELLGLVAYFVSSFRVVSTPFLVDLIQRLSLVVQSPKGLHLSLRQQNEEYELDGDDRK